MKIDKSLAGYQTQTQDICIEADLLCFDLWRQKSVAQRLQMGAQLTRSARQLAIDCFTQRKDTRAQVFTVISRVNHQEIAGYDGQGKVLRANPSLEDRQQWQQIRQRIENS